MPSVGQDNYRIMKYKVQNKVHNKFQDKVQNKFAGVYMCIIFARYNAHWIAYTA